MISRQQFYEFAQVDQHAQFENFLRAILFDKQRREHFYRQIIKADPQSVKTDTFRQYFEEYAAERKSNQQDYTPDAVSYLTAEITRINNKLTNDHFTAYDPAAGTGSLLIKKWWHDCLQSNPLVYQPHNYLYFAQEYADNAIPYLLHNLALRGMNAVVIHGDSLEKTANQVYFVQNVHDDLMQFSSINVMPHTEQVLKFFDLSKWTAEPINHIEDEIQDVQWVLLSNVYLRGS